MSPPPPKYPLWLDGTRSTPSDWVFYLQECTKDDRITEEQRHFTSLLLEPRSLNILTEDMYTKYLHGITEREVDFLDGKVINLDSCFNVPENRELRRDTRVSLTIRYVPKVLNVKLKFGKK